ncbi:hypothetical protein CTI12_AA322320 [Artemisia annua]|uniref:Uncharacterized protein n=1 Tax=Artemisia annua TaxID=35608 RepID=A0A2U1MFV9_ARTAN|nr:hypothetical protein CTI12_AA322320 [Artemisia annua]
MRGKQRQYSGDASSDESADKETGTGGLQEGTVTVGKCTGGLGYVRNTAEHGKARVIEDASEQQSAGLKNRINEYISHDEKYASKRNADEIAKAAEEQSSSKISNQVPVESDEQMALRLQNMLAMIVADPVLKAKYNELQSNRSLSKDEKGQILVEFINRRNEQVTFDQFIKPFKKDRSQRFVPIGEEDAEWLRKRVKIVDQQPAKEVHQETPEIAEGVASEKEKGFVVNILFSYNS